MFDAKKLTEEQVARIHAWAKEGNQLSEIQKRLEDEFGFRLTYMDVRFLILDLGVEIQVDKPESDKKEETPSEKELTEDDLEVLPPEQPAGNVRVTVDEIARPGVMVNGRVVFPDGESGMWYVDEMGRLGIEPSTPGYQPTEAYLIAFQKELQAVMERR